MLRHELGESESMCDIEREWADSGSEVCKDTVLGLMARRSEDALLEADICPTMT